MTRADPNYGKIPDLLRSADEVARLVDLLKAGVAVGASDPQQPLKAAEDIVFRFRRQVREIERHLRVAAERAQSSLSAMRHADDRVSDALEGVQAEAVDAGFDPSGCFVYLLWGDDADRPLYVGQSSNVLVRLGQHLGESRKRDLVRRVALVRCRDREQMASLEARLIHQHQPPWNVVGTAAGPQHPAGYAPSPSSPPFRGTSVGLLLDGLSRPPAGGAGGRRTSR